ncbi:2-deoxyribose-5-phosphate aldolase [Aspergillus clavatus NRRL 1]|uniref:deoxyribose-phosphate aldolase n=1 Tax=Aspergillus clavatus (strain ATCC 1007 / CBS 513.65 / DSM 816 / NCTC 3887 / NRRL 1 / QM 1276 / 107) TaxID=344612 RepID=A1CJC7_ASPCL|nr:deoxyribose-phosphate aldolase [Aspergillus clavatus NRRL 1]EAW09251.1 deoxyribose-phosphate aldolase [Aspergillus clavatus NRRL 1]
MLLPTNNEEWGVLISGIKDQLPDGYPIYQTPLPSAVHRTIDHTLLSLDATEEQIDKLCAEAMEHKFASVCVRLRHVNRAISNLRGFPEGAVACVVGFPEGTHDTTEKEKEALDAVELGASELDMVLNYLLLREKKYMDVYVDILEVRKVAPSPVKLKVILETSQLTRDEIIAATVLAIMAGADFVKTSTGFKGAGATVENVALMRATAQLVGKGTKVKASGGVRLAEDCVKMLKAGADRIGTSSGVAIVQQLKGLQIEGRASASY